MTEQSQDSYQQLHRKASEFVTRDAYLENELQIMAPKRWRLNLPKRDFNFEVEDLVPAISGTIGKIVMTTAIVTAFANGFGLTPEFIVANIRFEIMIAALLFAIPICGFLNPRANLPGCHGPMIPLIGLIIIAGGASSRSWDHGWGLWLDDRFVKRWIQTAGSNFNRRACRIAYVPGSEWAYRRDRTSKSVGR